MNKLTVNCQGLTPIVGIVLLSAIVLLSSSIFIFIIELSQDLETEAVSGVDVDEQPNKTTIMWTSNSNTEYIIVELTNKTTGETTEVKLESFGEQASFVTPKEYKITIIGYTQQQENGNGTVLKEI